jgi:hypothetical protein
VTREEEEEEEEDDDDLRLCVNQHMYTDKICAPYGHKMSDCNVLKSDERTQCYLCLTTT